jgi:hypothetical protein
MTKNIPRDKCHGPVGSTPASYFEVPCSSLFQENRFPEILVLLVAYLSNKEPLRKNAAPVFYGKLKIPMDVAIILIWDVLPCRLVGDNQYLG